MFLETDFDGSLIDIDIYGIPTNNLNYGNDSNSGSVRSYSNGILSCGYRFTEQSNSNSVEIWYNKIVTDADSIIWEFVIDNPDLIDVGVDIERYELDNTYILYTEQEEVVNPSLERQFIKLYKIDENGQILLESPKIKLNENTNAVDPRDMTIDNQGNIVIVAREEGRGYIAKLDTGLNLVWEKSFIQKHLNESLSYKHVLVAHDGHYVVAGNYGTPNNGTNADNELFGFITKHHSETGDTIWFKKVIHFHPDDSVVPRQHYVNAFALAPDSGFVLGGYVFFPAGSSLHQASWVKKVDKHGCSSAANCLITSVEDEAVLGNSLIKLSPNPVKNILSISTENIKLGSFTVLDVNGRVVYNSDSKLSSKTELINVEDFIPGVYVIQFEELGKSMKFVKL